jgi:hypothetical protein
MSFKFNNCLLLLGDSVLFLPSRLGPNVRTYIPSLFVYQCRIPGWSYLRKLSPQLPPNRKGETQSGCTVFVAP